MKDYKESLAEKELEVLRLRDSIDRACNALTDSICVSGNDYATNMHWVKKLKGCAIPLSQDEAARLDASLIPPMPPVAESAKPECTGPNSSGKDCPSCNPNISWPASPAGAGERSKA